MKSVEYFFCLLISTCLLSMSSVAQTIKDMAYADSLFSEHDYIHSGTVYKSLVSDASVDALHLNRLGYTELMTGDYKSAELHLKRALASHPPNQLKASIFSRLARISAIQSNEKVAMILLDSSISNGYLNYIDLDTLGEFKNMRNSTAFMELRNKLFNSIYPCYQNVRAHEFDFWVGEWEVYVTGTNFYAGNSSVQKVSGGCAILENWQSATSEGKSLNYIDDSSHKWKQVWVGSYLNGKQDFVNGEYTDSVMRFAFTTIDAQGRHVQGKFSFFNQSPNVVRQLNEISSDNGKTWTVSYDFTYKRKKYQN